MGKNTDAQRGNFTKVLPDMLRKQAYLHEEMCGRGTAVLWTKEVDLGVPGEGTEGETLFS